MIVALIAPHSSSTSQIGEYGDGPQRAAGPFFCANFGPPTL